MKSRIRRMFAHIAPKRFHYRREMGVVAGGLRLHRSRVPAGSGSSAALRRGIHRIEKGLSMRPRLPVFAEDYILETVEAFAELARSPNAEPLELRWAYRVLEAYFGLVSETPIIAAARARFTSLESLSDEGSEQPIPFSFRGSRRDSVSIDSFKELCAGRHSVRWFLDRSVPRECIDRAVICASMSPSACNRQPYFFRYLEGRDQASQVAEIAMGTGGYSHQIPALVVVLGDWSAIEFERDRHLPYIDGSLAAMSFMLALETMGLASCAINWPDIEDRERTMDRVLELPVHIRPIMLIAVGYPDPDGLVPYSQKKPTSSLIRTSNDYLP
jgi:nitroreductase